MRWWPESTAGIEEAPGRVSPMASAIAVMVEAVPIVMQMPAERAMPPCTPSHSSSVMLPARRSSQYFQASEPEPSTLPGIVAAQHRAGGQEDHRHAGGERAHDQPRRGLVAAAHQHHAVERVRADHLLGLHRQHVAVEHRGRLGEAFVHRQRRQLDREAARLQHAALDVLHALGEVRRGRN